MSQTFWGAAVWSFVTQGIPLRDFLVQHLLKHLSPLNFSSSLHLSKTIDMFSFTPLALLCLSIAVSGLDQHCCEGNDHELQSTHTIIHTTFYTHTTYLPESTHTITDTTFYTHTTYLPESTHTITHTYTIHLPNWIKDLCYAPTGTRTITHYPTHTITPVAAQPTIEADIVTRTKILQGLNVETTLPFVFLTPTINFLLYNNGRIPRFSGGWHDGAFKSRTLQGLEILL